MVSRFFISVFKLFSSLKVGTKPTHKSSFFEGMLLQARSWREPGGSLAPLKLNLVQGRAPKFRVYLFLFTVKNVLGLLHGYKGPKHCLKRCMRKALTRFSLDKCYGVWYYGLKLLPPFHSKFSGRVPGKLLHET